MVIAIALGGFAPHVASAIEPVDEPPTDTVVEPSTIRPITSESIVFNPADSLPPTTDNAFFPEDRDLTDCVGVLERPGCGSESRGGWRQFAILGVIAVGLTVVFGNVVRGVRRNAKGDTPDDTD